MTLLNTKATWSSWGLLIQRWHRQRGAERINATIYRGGIGAIIYRWAFAVVCCVSWSQGFSQITTDTIPLGGNAWCSSDKGGRIENKGIVDWSDGNVWFDAWFRVSKTGKLHLWLLAAVPAGKTRLRIAVEGAPGAAKKLKGVELEMEGAELKRYDAGEFMLYDTGYQCIRIKSISRSGLYFAAIPSIIVSGEPINDRTAFVPNNDGNFFHWGRRGPSVHLNYSLAKEVDAEWFYNEVTVPEKQDVQGSYFMACGFAQGYFGMQVNSPTERHILFSVWSPFQTDNPEAIPDSLKIQLLKKGEAVHTGAFGNEGSGGQSYLNYPWKAGHTYRFLLRAHPADRGYTDFTAWFFAPEEGRWRLIAGFSRPGTQSWLNSLHSFLENFEPEQGTHKRWVFFNHQWVRDVQGHWISLNRARFTVDNTGRKGYRMDYAGGIRDSAFYLQNDGFFGNYTPAGIWLERPPEGIGGYPQIDFAGLP